MIEYIGQQEARSRIWFEQAGYPAICTKPGVDARDMAQEFPKHADHLRIMAEDLASFKNQPIEETIRQLQEAIDGAGRSMKLFMEAMRKTLIFLNPRAWWISLTKDKLGKNSEDDPNGLWS